MITRSYCEQLVTDRNTELHERTIRLLQDMKQRVLIVKKALQELKKAEAVATNPMCEAQL